jgi:hypothetical protein
MSLRHRVADVVGISHPLRQTDAGVLDLVVGHLTEQVVNAVQACFFLVDCLHHPPRCFRNVGALDHGFFGAGVIFPAPAAFQVHRAELPLLERIVDTAQKAGVLFIVRDRKPVLDQLNAAAHQHFFEFGHRTEELFVLVVVAKAHDFFNPRAVVPTAVKQHDLARGR